MKTRAKPPRVIRVYLLVVLSLWVKRQEKDKNPPPHVLAPLACLRRAVGGTAEIGQEDPSNQGDDKLAHVPPSGERSEQPLVARAVSMQYTAKGGGKRTHLAGRNSKKINESTGTFPPAAVPITAQSALKATKFIAPAHAQRKTPAISRVQLNAGFRPMKSEEIPQNDAPRMRPI